MLPPLAVPEIIADEPPVVVDTLQEVINDYVMNFELLTPSGYCGFRLNQEMDAELNMYKTVAVHNCNNYGVSLTLYLKPGDFEEKTVRELLVEDEEGNVTNQNVLDECRPINSTYTMCKFYMAPEN